MLALLEDVDEREAKCRVKQKCKEIYSKLNSSKILKIKYTKYLNNKIFSDLIQN